MFYSFFKGTVRTNDLTKLGCVAPLGLAIIFYPYPDLPVWANRARVHGAMTPYLSSLATPSLDDQRDGHTYRLYA